MVAESTRRQDIIDCAAELFFRHGYDGTSMQQVADKAGLHKSSLYHHVQSKVELLEAICTTALDSLFASLEDTTSDDATAGERVLAVFDSAARVALGDVRRISIVLHLSADDGVAARVWERRREYDHRFAQLMREGQLSGEIREDIDALLLTRLVLGMVNWVTQWYRPGGGRYDAEEVVRSLATFVRGGVRPQITLEP